MAGGSPHALVRALPTPWCGLVSGRLVLGGGDGLRDGLLDGLDGLHVLAAGAAVDGDLARLRLGHLGHAQGEHALLDVRLDAVRVDAARHRHGTAELTARHTAEPVPAVVVLGPGDAPADR